MKNLKLNIELMPLGAWGNNLRTILPQKHWDILRKICYEKANGKCQICGYKTEDLEAHEVWEFDIKKQTQTLNDIIALCPKCHGVKHFKNSTRLGYGENAKQHFLKVNNCKELDFANHLTQAMLDFEEQNTVYRWKIIANLNKFGLKNVEIKQRNIPLIRNPYENVDWEDYSFMRHHKNMLFYIEKNHSYCSEPKILSIKIDNYQGLIEIICEDAKRIEWFLDDIKIKTKYNVVGKFISKFNVKNLNGKNLRFVLYGDGGQTSSKAFELLPQEVYNGNV